MSAVSRQVRRFEARRNRYWDYPRDYQATSSTRLSAPTVTAFDWSRLRTKNDDPAYRKSIWPASKIERRRGDAA